MNPKRAHFKALSVLLTLLLLYSLTVLPVNASAGTIYESESNNTYGTADITYDDYDTYGSLPTNDTVDWWKISITAEGMANFYLGNIPSGCDYDLQLYDYTGTKLLAESLKGSNAAELIKCHVRAGETYYIKVYRASYPGTLSSANYQLRVKRYNLQEANIFSSPDGYSGLPFIATNMRNAVNNLVNQAEYMGFEANGLLEQSSIVAYDKFTESSIYIIYSGGGKGYVNLCSVSDLFAEGTEMNDFGAAVSLLPANALNNLPLVIYASAYSALEEDENSIFACGNLLTTTLNKGAFNVIAWESAPDAMDMKLWLEKFMSYCSSGFNIGNSLLLTNEWALTAKTISDPESITATCHGSSRIWATLIG